MGHGAQHRYEQAIQFVLELMEQGSLTAGQKAPSLREVSRNLRVSITTAMRAYQELEGRGVLEARPKSGFFVTGLADSQLSIPNVSEPPQQPQSVSVSERVFNLTRYVMDTSLLPLGCAVPSPDLLAANPLDRHLARLARTKGRTANIYAKTEGLLGLRQEIARRAERWGQVIEPEHMAITCGCTEALHLALKAVSKPSDVIAVETPVYFGVLQILEALNLKVLEVPTNAETGVELAALDQALTEGKPAACLLSSCFNNPLGCMVPESNKIEILKILDRHQVPLIEDDIYGDLHFSSDRHRPFMAYDRKGQVIYCSSFSKTLAPGYRIGWVVAPSHIRNIIDGKFSLTLCSPTLPQMALEEFLRSGGYDRHLRRLRRQFADTVSRMSRSIVEHFPKGTRVSRPKGGFVLWLELPGQLDSTVLFEEMLEHGICIAPGTVFSSTDLYRNCVRLSCGYPWSEKMSDGIAQIGAWCHGRMK